MKNLQLLKAVSGAAILALSFPASASMIDITDINLEVRTSTYTTTGSESYPELLNEFYSNGSAVCDVSISSVDNVGSVQTCGGPNTNIATLISVSLEQTVSTLWQFGADWGRGGVRFIYEGFGVQHYTGDTWWNYDWENTDVIEFSLGAGAGTFGLLGFEGCCGGGMSLRYSQDGGETWQIAAVPEPSAIALLGLSLLGLGFARRRQVA